MESDWERWRGSVDARLSGHDNALESLGQDVRDSKGMLVALGEQVAALRSKVSFGAAAGGLVGAGAFTIIGALLNHKF